MPISSIIVEGVRVSCDNGVGDGVLELFAVLNGVGDKLGRALIVGSGETFEIGVSLGTLVGVMVRVVVGVGVSVLDPLEVRVIDFQNA